MVVEKRIMNRVDFAPNGGVRVVQDEIRRSTLEFPTAQDALNYRESTLVSIRDGLLFGISMMTAIAGIAGIQGTDILTMPRDVAIGLIITGAYSARCIYIAGKERVRRYDSLNDEIKKQINENRV